jgi:hypothetical protein
MPADLPAIIDLEASGFGRGSYPIEVGFVLPEGAMYCTLILPPPHWRHWDTTAQAVHHITREVLLSHGKPATEVAHTLNTRLQGLTLYSDGWANDFTWLNLLFDEADMTPAFRLDNLRALLDEQQADAWHACKASVLSELQMPRHRASTDARVLQLTFARLASAAVSPSTTTGRAPPSPAR